MRPIITLRFKTIILDPPTTTKMAEKMSQNSLMSSKRSERPTQIKTTRSGIRIRRIPWSITIMVQETKTKVALVVVQTEVAAS